MVDSTPSRFLQGQAAGASLSEMRTLALDIFGGEVLTAFDLALIAADKVQNRTLTGGMRSARFPKIWKATAEYHTAGKELLGNEIETGEISITPDEILVAHTAIYDLDDMLGHFDVRSQFATELGRALARVYDKNIFRQIIKAARTAADGPFPGGNVITDATLVNTGTIDGNDWIAAIKSANKLLFNKDVPDDQPRFMVVNWDVFDAIKFAKDGNGRYILLNAEYRGNQSGGFSSRDDTLSIDGVTIYKTRNAPTTNETADSTVYTKYRADYSTTTGILWNPMAVASVKMKAVSLEQTRDVRRQENFMVASSLSGNGTLRPECAVEFKTA
ncbi:MAG: phage capsid protein [Devosia sp.]|nr:phage capsid protein [Devosia sp.]